jgi:hypothetical protein
MKRLIRLDRVLPTAIVAAAAAWPLVADCNADTAGTTEEVPYTADYYFWKAVGGGDPEGVGSIR